MSKSMENEIHYVDELLAAFSVADKPALNGHLPDEDLIRYAGGALDAAEAWRIDSHLATCSHCLDRLDHLLSESTSWNNEPAGDHLEALAKRILASASLASGQPEIAIEPTAGSVSDSYDSGPTLRLRTETELELITFLDGLGVIERDHDYILPSGLHSDTYINTSKLCRSEDSLSRIARAFDTHFDGVEFTTIVAAGWAMGMIARRLSKARATSSGKVIRVVIAEGYSSLSFSEDMDPGAKTLLLVDVCVTGRSLHHMADSVRRSGATVVAKGCIASPAGSQDAALFGVRSLTAVDMDLVDPTRSTCPRCPVLRKLVFNPISAQMTVKKLVPRSPTQFLAEFPEASSFWEMLDATQAYEHHHIEDNNHYIAFVNTAKILAHRTLGPKIVREFFEMVRPANWPRVLLVPNRSRARLLADKFVELLDATSNGAKAMIVLSNRRHGAWTLDSRDHIKIRNADVLILDTAAGHGCVLDELSLVANEAGARSLSAAVLLSRLSISCEEAFRDRWGGHFFRLFHLPIRPVAIRNDRSMCPICHQRDLIQQAATEQNAAAIQDLARLYANLKGRPRKPAGHETAQPRMLQRTLFDLPKQPLLYRCRRATASGVALHALHTSMTDGMAPLVLPELKNSEIPGTNRVAMLENLPPGVFEWSQSFLDQSVEDVLAQIDDEKVWLASVEVLAREGRTYWVAHLKAFLEQHAELQLMPREMFWNRLAYGVYRLAEQDADIREEMKGVVEPLREEYRQTTAGKGLQRVMEVLSSHRESLADTEEEFEALR